MAKATKAVKMADLASTLNISTVTVSKALSDQPGVGEELRRKIKQLADDMGYKTPTALKLAKTHKSYNIGVIVSERYLGNNDSFYWKLYQEVTNKAISKECFTLLEVVTSEAETYFHMPKLILENKIDGLIVIGKPGADYAGNLRSNTDIPLIFLDFYDSDILADSVISDGFYGTYMLTNYLFDYGHKDIAYVGTLLATESITDRYLGYLKALMEHGIELRQDRIIRDRNIESGQLEAYSGVELPDDMPSAFVCNCDYIASMVIKELRKKGYRVPEDVSVVGFDNYLYPGLSDIGITTYEVDVKEMARMAVNSLIKKMSGEPYKKGIRIVEGHFIEKESVAVPR